MNSILESYLDHIQSEGTPALVGTTIAVVMGASAATNAYTAYKERVREYGRTNKECIEKCEIKFNESNIMKHPEDYSQEDIRRLKQNKQDCINKCNARFYNDMTEANKRKEKIKKNLIALRTKAHNLRSNKKVKHESLIIERTKMIKYFMTKKGMDYTQAKKKANLLRQWIEWKAKNA